MKVAVTLRIMETQNYVEPRDAISQDWQQYLQESGYTPIFIGNGLKDVVAYVEEVGVDAVMLSNGENVALGKDADGNWTGSVRDITEAKLLDWAISKKIPVLGVCRGMQFINCYFGGQLENNVEGHVTKAHEIKITMEYFRQLYGSDTVTVNSYHQAAVVEKSLGDGLLVWAIKDQIVEGIVHETYPILGIEWHPERQKPLSGLDQNLIKEFFNQTTCIQAMCQQ